MDIVMGNSFIDNLSDLATVFGGVDALCKVLLGASIIPASVAAGASLGMSGNPVADIANGLNFITSGVQDMTRLNYPTVSGVGSSGSYMSFHDPKNLYLLSRFNYIVDENLAEIGRPLCQTKQINTLSGYILCMLADAQITGTAEEAKQINTYMNTGFFYE